MLHVRKKRKKSLNVNRSNVKSLWLLFSLKDLSGVSLRLIGQNGQVLASRELSLYCLRTSGVSSSVRAFCEKNNLTPNKLKGIAVVMGVGSFTSLRLVVAVANVWHWLYGLSLVALSPNEVNSFKPNQFELSSADFLTPKYSGQPNVAILQNKKL